jgi:hypothetical protein
MTFPANMHSPGSWWTTEDNHVHHTPELPASLVIYVPHASARRLDNRRPRARSSPRSQPRRRGPLDRGEAPELGPAVLVPSSTHRSAPSALGGFELGANKLGRSDRDRAWHACAVCAPHRRTAPPIRGCAAGCAVGGANPTPPAHRRVTIRWGRGGPPTAASHNSAVGPCHRSQPAGRLSRYPTRTPSAVQHPQAPVCGPQRATHGPGQGSLRGPRPCVETDSDLRRLLAYPVGGRTICSRWLCPSWGLIGRGRCGRLGPV